MSDDIIDSVLNEKTLDMLDKHGATIDKVDGLLSKIDSILGKPLIKDVFDLLKDKAMSQVEQVTTDTWGVTIGDMQGAQQTAIPIQQAPQQVTQQPALITGVLDVPVKSELHQSVHDSIDQMTEDELCEMIDNAKDNTNSSSDNDT